MSRGSGRLLSLMGLSFECYGRSIELGRMGLGILEVHSY